MKSVVVASALFASLALAAPVNKRAYATKTHTVVETVVVYTTVWDAQPAATEAAAAPSSSPALFFENHSSAAAVVSSSAAAVVVSSSSVAPVVPTPAASSSVIVTPTPQAPSSTPVPVVESPTPTPEPVVTPTPSPEPTPTPAPAPEPSSEPAPVVHAPSAPAESKPSPPTSGGGSGQSYTGSLTMNYYKGGLGACGKPVNDGENMVALSVAGFGDATVDPMTGLTTNPWCGQKIRVTYNGKTADAVVMDRCSGCTGLGGLDATPALWNELTGGLGGASGDRLETGMSFTKIN